MSDVKTETQPKKTFDPEAFAMNLARAMESSGQALAAYLKPREIHREGFGIEGFFGLGFGLYVAHIDNTTDSFVVRHRARSSMSQSKLISALHVLHCDRNLGSVIFRPHRFSLLSTL